jgi:hypothetical protein
VAVSAVATYADVRLVYAARLYCDAAAEPPHLFVLDLEMPIRFVLGPILACVPYVLVDIPGRVSPLGRSALGRTIVTLTAVAVGVGAASSMIIFDFATTGTLNGYPGDSGLCGPDNVPPWWPSWPPA